MEMLQQFAGVVMVFGLLGAALFWLRQRGLVHFPAAAQARRKGGALRSVERLVLSPQHTLHLVNLHNRSFLIAVWPNGCKLIESSAAMGADADRSGAESL